MPWQGNRDLRREMYLAYINRGDNNNANDNKAVIAEILKLRQQKAHLFGFDNFAQYQLEDKMAKTPEAAYDLLMTIWNAALPKAKAEAAELQKMMDAEGKGEKLEAWAMIHITKSCQLLCNVLYLAVCILYRFCIIRGTY